jgi:hypothetical protein
MVDMNLAWSVDLCVTDIMKLYTGKPPVHESMAEPGIVIVGSNSIATDAVSVCIMKQNEASRLADIPVREHLTFTLGEAQGLGSSGIDDINLISTNLAEDPEFDQVLKKIREELA